MSNFIYARYNDKLDVVLVDSNGDPLATPAQTLAVVSEPNTTDIINERFCIKTGTTSTLAANTAIGATSFLLDDASSFSVGNTLLVVSTIEEGYFPIITAISVNTVTIDRPLDIAHSIGGVVEIVEINMNVNASLASPAIYAVGPDPGVVWDILRIIIIMAHSSAGDLGLFGDITALTNGVVVRTKVSGVFRTLTNWKTNGQIKKDFFNVDFDARSGGQGSFGTSGNGNFSALQVALRLDGDNADQLQVLIQDNISTLNNLHVNAQGHIEVD